ncbi:hypothetical protein DND132_3151 [Pseudodesulfovibrio mercurii]|uniref:Uncharacterized protein n=1 Tax=Pseudodesulfovibrio mercurii TaxID=641491 RepID=F0JKA5_9BACT|nr:hypothetical protein [Pseudodesulfovibrio mercurii]EGB16354.1 hypothetical protein DND132_3151 [Pseudodesulfovibrio mercurii]
MAEGWRKHESQMPRLGESEGVLFEDKEIWLHFFRLDSDSHWMATEANGKGLYFGYVVQDGDFENAKWGYFTLAEIAMVPGLLVLCRKTVKRFVDVIAEVMAG